MTEAAARVSALVKGYAGTRVLDIEELEFAPCTAFSPTPDGLLRAEAVSLPHQRAAER